MGGLREIYNGLSSKNEGLKTAGFEKFQVDMQNDDNLRKVFDGLASKNEQLGEYGFDKFKADMFPGPVGAVKKKDGTNQSSHGSGSPLPPEPSDPTVWSTMDLFKANVKLGSEVPELKEGLIGAEPDETDKQLVDDYQSMFNQDPRAVGLTRQEIEHELRLSHPDYEPQIYAGTPFTMLDDETFEQLGEEEKTNLQNESAKLHQQINDRKTFEDARKVTSQTIKEYQMTDAAFVLISDEAEHKILEQSWTEGGGQFPPFRQAYQRKKDAAWKRLIDPTTSLRKEVESEAAQHGGTEAMLNPETRDKVKTAVLNKRLHYGVNMLSPEHRQLYALQGQRSTLLQRLQEPMNPADQVTLTSQLDELNAQIENSREAVPALFDPATGEYLDPEDADDEKVQRAQAYEKDIQKLMVRYEDTDLGSLVNSWNQLQSKLKYVEQHLGNQATIEVPGNDNISVSDVYELKRYTEKKGAGFGMPLGGDAATKITKYTDVLLETRKKFDAVNRTLLLNMDPGSVQKNAGSLFLEYAAEGFGFDIKTDVDWVETYVAAIKETGGTLTKAQEEAAKDELKHTAAKGFGASVRPMLEIMVTSYGIGAVGRIPMIAKYSNMLKAGMVQRWGKRGELAYNVTKGQLQGTLSFGLTSDENLSAMMGTGEGTVQGVLDHLNVEKFFRKSKWGKVAEFGMRLGFGTTTETIQEFAGDYLDNLSSYNYNWELAFDETFGREPEDFIDKLVLTGLLSAGFSGAFNAKYLAQVRTVVANSESPHKEELLNQIDTAVQEQEQSNASPEESTEPAQEETAEQARASGEIQPQEEPQLDISTLPKDEHRQFTPEEEQQVKSNFEASGLTPPVTATEVISTGRPVIDLANRWDEVYGEYEEIIEQPRTERIQAIETEIDGLKDKRKKTDREQRKALKEEIVTLTEEIEFGRGIIEQEALSFQDQVMDYAKQRAREMGHNYDGLEAFEKGQFMDGLSQALFDNRMVENHHNQPARDVIDFLVDDHFSSRNKAEPTKQNPSSDPIKSVGDPSINEGFLNSQVNRGKKTKIRLPNGEMRESEFALVDADKILASHDEVNFNNTKGYPTQGGRSVNPRNYKADQNAQGQIDQIAKNLDPFEIISNAANPSTGTPIITPDGIVVSGNGRTMSIKRAIKSNPEGYAAYVNHLKGDIGTYGLTEEQLAQHTNPILVRVDNSLSEYSPKELDRYNKQSQKEEANIDKVVKIGKILSDNPEGRGRIMEVISRYDTMSDFFSDRKAQETVMKLLQNEEILLDNELSKYLDTDGTFNRDGKELVQDSLLGLVLDEDTLRVSEIQGVKSFRRNVVNAIPALTKNYTLGEYSLQTELNKAIQLQAQFQQSGIDDFATFVAQHDLFEGLADANVIKVNRMVSTGPKRFKKMVQVYNQSAELSSQGGGLFGESEVLDKEQILTGLNDSSSKQSSTQNPTPEQPGKGAPDPTGKGGTDQSIGQSAKEATDSQEVSEADTGSSSRTLENQINEITSRSDETFDQVSSQGLSSGRIKRPPINKTELQQQIQFADSTVEDRFREAEKLHGPAESTWTKSRDWTKSTLRNFQRHFKHLNPRKFPELANKLRVFESLSDYSKVKSEQYVKGILEPLTSEQKDILVRRIILEDLIYGVDGGKEVEQKLPFGFKSRDEVQSELNKFVLLMDQEPEAQKAYDARTGFMKELYEQMVNKNVIADQGNYQSYYHRRVLQYIHDDVQQQVIHGKRLTKAQRNFMKQRTGTMGKDYSTNFLESEFRVVADALFEIKKKETFDAIFEPYQTQLKELKQQAAIAYDYKLKQLKKQFDSSDKIIQVFQEKRSSFIQGFIAQNKPEGYTVYQPSPGNNLFRQSMVTQGQIEGTLEYLKTELDLVSAVSILELLAAGSSDFLVVGGKKTQYLIPEELAATLEDIGSPRAEVTNLEKLFRGATTSWKAYVLLNPKRVVKYNINNMIGDLDGVLAADPTILKHGQRAWKEIFQYAQTGKVNNLMNAALEQAVIDSGFDLTELSDINKQKWAKYFNRKKVTLADLADKNSIREMVASANPVSVYYNWVRKWTGVRENWLRYAAFSRAVEKIDNGDSFYWASDPKQIDAITDKYEKAGKLSREALGDYGNISETGQYIRKHLIPFYSWMEINMGRYVRLLRNTASPKAQARIAGIALGRGVAKLSVKTITGLAQLGILTAAIAAWNRMAFPDEDDELRGADARGMHIILGRNDAGQPISIPVVGAFYDFADFFGIPDLYEELNMMLSGQSERGMSEAGETILKAPINKIWQGVTPLVKSPTEFVSGQETFPSVFERRPIKDRTEKLARMFSLDQEYRAIAGKPSRHKYWDWETATNLAIRSFDVEQAAYWQTIALIGKERGFLSGSDPGNPEIAARKEALYHFGASLRYGLDEEASTWLEKYYEHDGTLRGLRTSLATRHPLHRLSKEEKADVNRILKGEAAKSEFGKKLNDFEVARIRMAIDYYEKTFGAGQRKLQSIIEDVKPK